MQSICKISGKEFSVSVHEQELRGKFGFADTPPDVLPKHRFQYLGAFWPHWNLYKRKCDKTGKNIVSIFRPDCAYPVWQRDEWIANANPPSKDFDFSRSFFEQAFELFPKCPIPHIFQSHNENCEYTDDWYYSKNCYLCHSGQNNEDCRYCYGCDSIKNLHNSVFSFESELCIDLINSRLCFNSSFLVNCKNIYDSSFLYDCRDCRDCLFCCNLRNKKYCLGNEQLTQSEFEKKKKEWDFSSFQNYEKAKEHFAEMMKEMAWHRALQIDHCENSTGNFIYNCKDCENCYMLSCHENCANISFSGPHVKSVLDSLGTVGGELTFMCSLPVYSYEARFCFSVSHCRFVDYCAYMQNCHYCFGCCGLVNQEYCIFNKKYPKEEYETLRNTIIQHMKKTGEWGNFFTPQFAPNPYDESYSGFYFPLSENEKTDQGFVGAQPIEKISVKTAEINEIPDSLDSLTSENEDRLLKQIFWDDKYQRPFQIQQADIDFRRRLNIPLPRTYYINRIQSNLRWMPFSGELRETNCAKAGDKIQTNWSPEYDKRILCEQEYLKHVK
jgi:hypothetical protein